MKKLILPLLNLFSAYQMAKFAIPKLTSAPISVNSFNQFGEVLGINGHSFMLFTGALELVVALVLMAAVLLYKQRQKWLLTGLGNLLLLGTMLGALMTEFFVRPAPIPFLVGLASGLIAIALVQLTFSGHQYRLQR